MRNKRHFAGEQAMYTIDRIEGAFAVLEQDGILKDVPLSDLPEGVREGDLLMQTEDGWTLCDGTERRRRIAARRRRLLEDKS